MNISNFIKQNIPLCACTLGFAIIGYFGYHAARWIINKCQKTEKIDQIGQNHLSFKGKESDIKKPPKSLINRVKNLDTTVRRGNRQQGGDAVHYNVPKGNKIDKKTEKIPKSLQNLVFDNEKVPASKEKTKQPEKPEGKYVSMGNLFLSSAPISKIDEPSKSPKSLINRVSNLNVPEGKVETGQGEYIVFHNLPTDEKKEVTKETYNRVYQVLIDYAPASIVNRNSESAMDECENRYQIIKSKVKEIDSTLEVFFVPRTLYELIFIRKCIREDLKDNKICSQLSPDTWCNAVTIKDFEGNQKKFESFEMERIKNILKEKNCWHLCFFDHPGDNKHPGVRDVAYRLNRAIVKTLSPPIDGFSYKEFSLLTERQIKFLTHHFQTKGGGRVHCRYSGPTNNFGSESSRGMIYPMPISEDKHAQIIRNALVLGDSVKYPPFDIEKYPL